MSRVPKRAHYIAKATPLERRTLEYLQDNLGDRSAREVARALAISYDRALATLRKLERHGVIWRAARWRAERFTREGEL